MLTRITLLGLLVLAGCTFDGRKKTVAARPATPTAGADADGKPLSVADHAGKVVLLSFWHSQCPPCRALFVHEKQLVAKHPPGLFALVGVNADAEPATLKATQEKARLNYASIADGPDGPVCAAWGVESFPTLVLLDPSGRVRWRHVGTPDPAEMDGRIRRLIEETQLTVR